MAEEKTEYRKLSAIMFTDMVGYSAMVQKNESLALELLKEHRKLLRPIFSKHSGDEVETSGDAFFVEFNSALEAAQCAIEIQKELHDRNLKFESDKQIIIRIGLHVGDVVHMGKHVHGDDVNIAARIEPFSVPGGICLSEDVYRQIHNKIELPLSRIGTKNLKNIKSPIDIYSVDLPWIKNQKQPKKQIIFNPLTKRNFISSALIIVVVLTILFIWENLDEPVVRETNNRIAVLPLVNISQDSEDEYFADGMTEELISQLAKISGLSVIARTSVMKYKNTQMNIEEIGRELDVGSIFAGSVRKASDKARITIQLIDVYSQEHLWAEDYDRELRDIFAIQSDIALRIANELKVQLAAIEKEQIEKTGTESAEAYRMYLLAKHQLNQRISKSIFKGIEYFQKAIEIDPEFALPYVGIADCYTLISGAGYGSFSRDEAIILAKDAVNNALQIDNSLADAYNSMAYLQFRFEWDWESADSNFKKALELKPGFATAYERYALFLALLGRYDEALPLMLRARELDPLSASVSTGVGRIFHFSQQYDKAIEQFNRTLELDPDYVEAVFARGLSYSQIGRYNDAISELQKAIELSNGRLIIISALGSVYAMAGLNDEVLKTYDQLVNLSKEKKVSPLNFSVIDAALGNYDQAFDSLYKAYDEHFGILVYIKASPIYNNLKSDQRFVELTRMIGLEK
jgi:TolB-like protein/class 3 adenylate cyclase/Tfp pilus assembly protein PilF